MVIRWYVYWLLQHLHYFLSCLGAQSLTICNNYVYKKCLHH